MKTYSVEITETITAVIDVEADSAEDARNQVRDRYNDCDIVLDGYSNSNCETEFTTLSEVVA